MKCKECGARFDFPIYIIPALANWNDVDALEQGASLRDGSKNMLIPACPRCYRFTGYKKLLGL